MNKINPILEIFASSIGNQHKEFKKLDTSIAEGVSIKNFSIYDALEAVFVMLAFIISKNIDKEFKMKMILNEILGSQNINPSKFW